MPITGEAKKNQVKKGAQQVKVRHSAVYLRARLLKVINESINVIEKKDKGLDVLLAEAIIDDPLAGLQLISKFLPREQEINLHTSVDLHLTAVRDLVDAARTSIKDITPGREQMSDFQAADKAANMIPDLERAADQADGPGEEGLAPGHGQVVSMSRDINHDARSRQDTLDSLDRELCEEKQ